LQDSTIKETPRAAAKPPIKANKSLGKKNDKTKSTEELDQLQVEAEAEKLRKKQEAEQAAAEAAEAKKDRIRPKQYTTEEKADWRKYVNEFSDFFGELVQKQVVEKEESPDAEFGKRTFEEINVEYDYSFLCEWLCLNKVPEPIWPDPDKEPLPPPVITSILKKPPNR
jgi:hypothetical protein